MDVLLWDEAIYLDRGFLLWKIIPNTWGPIYSVWYKLLSYIEQNKIALYYLNYKVLYLLSTVLIYLFMVALRTPKTVAFFFACIWLSHPSNLPSWPKISHFAICIIFFTAIFIQYIENNLNKAFIFSIALLICGFARPELYLSFIFSFFFLIFLIIRHRKILNKINFVSAAIWLIFVAFTYKLYRTPLTNGDAQRGLGVFIQHFALNYSIWNKQDILWWFDFQDTVNKCFQPPYTLTHLAENSFFWKHIFFNLKLFCTKTFSLISGLFLPFYFLKKVLFFIASCIILIYILIKNKNSFSLFFRNIKEQKLLFILLIIATAPSMLSAIYAHPRTHYLIMFLPMMFFLIAALFSSSTQNNFKQILFIFFVFAVLTPSSKDFKYFDLYGTNKNMMNKKTIHYIEDKYGKDTTLILDIDGLLPSLMNQNFRYCNIRPLVTDQKVLISDIIQDEQPDVIYITPTILKLRKNKTDTIFHQLLSTPEIFHYKKDNIPDLADVYLLVKEQ